MIRGMTVTPPLTAKGMYETDLAFCATYEDGTVPLESYTEHIEHTEAKRS